MNCREFEADVVDLARGADMSATAAARLGAHLEHCAGCTARFASERRLTAALKAVAGAAPPSTRTEAIEAQLLLAFARQQAAASRPAPARGSVFARPTMRTWLAAAAGLVLAVAVWQGAARRPSPDPARPVSTPAALAPSVPAAQEATMAGRDARPGAPTTAASPGAFAKAGPRPARASRQPGPRAVPADGGEVLRFVMLPTAIGLPALESGRIVRVEVPVAMLPAYGLDVTPDAAASAVEADVLVGQDGQPRAIRFVTLETDSRRRQ